MLYFSRFMFHKTKNNYKKWFCKSCLQCFPSENILIKHKENYLSINGMQSAKVEEGIIEFQNYFKQISVSFKSYADFECKSESIEIYEGSYTKNIMILLLVALLTKLFALMIHLVSLLLSIEEKMLLMNFVKKFLKRIIIAKK